MPAFRRIELGITIDRLRFWRPQDDFTVNGISYNYHARGECHVAPMFCLKPLHDNDGEWDSPHVSNAGMLTAMRENFSIYQDLSWDPDIIF